MASLGPACNFNIPTGSLDIHRKRHTGLRDKLQVHLCSIIRHYALVAGVENKNLALSILIPSTFPTTETPWKKSLALQSRRPGLGGYRDPHIR